MNKAKTTKIIRVIKSHLHITNYMMKRHAFIVINLE